MTTVNEKQVGGSHYKTTKLGIPEHWDIVAALGWDYFIGAATKYLWRLGKKNTTLQGQIEDLDKAIHYLEKKREILRNEFDKLRKSAVTTSDPINGPE